MFQSCLASCVSGKDLTPVLNSCFLIPYQFLQGAGFPHFPLQKSLTGFGPTVDVVTSSHISCFILCLLKQTTELLLQPRGRVIR